MEMNLELSKWAKDEFIDMDWVADMIEDGYSIEEVQNKYYQAVGEDR